MNTTEFLQRIDARLNHAFAAMDLGQERPRYCYDDETMKPRVEYPSLWIHNREEAPKLSDEGKAVISYRVRRRETENDPEKGPRHSLTVEVIDIEEVKKAARELCAPAGREVEFGRPGLIARVVNRGRGMVRHVKEDLTGARATRISGKWAERNERLRKAAANEGTQKKTLRAMHEDAARTAKAYREATPLDVARSGPGLSTRARKAKEAVERQMPRTEAASRAAAKARRQDARAGEASDKAVEARKKTRRRAVIGTTAGLGVVGAWRGDRGEPVTVGQDSQD